jgi:hypothetical protein
MQFALSLCPFDSSQYGMGPTFFAASYNQEANDLTFSLNNNPLGRKSKNKNAGSC